MTRLFTALILMLTFTLGTFAKTTETLDVQENNKVWADRGRLMIRFVEVVEDSRCPRNAKCVSEGNAKIRLAISKGKGPERTVELNTGVDPKAVNLYGYTIKLLNLGKRVPESMAMMDRPLNAHLSVVRQK